VAKPPGYWKGILRELIAEKRINANSKQKMLKFKIYYEED
jgi:hypothetical protein